MASLGRSTVIKVLRHEVATVPNRVERFLREAQLASRLDHPYAAHVYAFGAELDGLLRRVDRWIGAMWLGAIERALGIDERSAGDVAGFVKEFPTLSARILGPEETAVLSWSIARMHRDRPDGWAAKVGAQASRLASHTGSADQRVDPVFLFQKKVHDLGEDDAAGKGLAHRGHD